MSVIPNIVAYLPPARLGITGVVLFRPRGFLGEGLFDKYRDALARLGGVFDGSIRATKIPAARGRLAIDALLEAGFAVNETGEVEQVIKDAVLEEKTLEAKDGNKRSPDPVTKPCVVCDRFRSILPGDYGGSGRVGKGNASDIDKALAAVHRVFRVSAGLARSELQKWKEREGWIAKEIRKGKLCERCIKSRLDLIFEEAEKVVPEAREASEETELLEKNEGSRAETDEDDLDDPF